MGARSPQLADLGRHTRHVTTTSFLPPTIPRLPPTPHNSTNKGILLPTRNPSTASTNTSFIHFSCISRNKSTTQPLQRSNRPRQQHFTLPRPSWRRSMRRHTLWLLRPSLLRRRPSLLHQRTHTSSLFIRCRRDQRRHGILVILYFHQHPNHHTSLQHLDPSCNASTNHHTIRSISSTNNNDTSSRRLRNKSR